MRYKLYVSRIEDLTTKEKEERNTGRNNSGFYNPQPGIEIDLSSEKMIPLLSTTLTEEQWIRIQAATLKEAK